MKNTPPSGVIGEEINSEPCLNMNLNEAGGDADKKGPANA
jgi:hypothetical protein